MRSTRLCLLFSSLVGGALWAQGTGEILGNVTDPSGAVVVGARVELRNEAQGWTRDTTTSDIGAFQFAAVPVGQYSVQVQAAGFQTYFRSGIILQAVTEARVDISLAVGAAAETVNVEANAEQVNTTSATLKTVVDRERVQNLPLNGRNPLQLLSLLPGGVQRGPVDQFISTPTFAVNGANQDQVNYRLDGGDHMDTWFGSSLSYPNPDALQEFTVQTNNFSARYGRNAGAVVDAVVRSGTNQLHGSLFEYFRNDELDARPFFAARRPVFHRNQFGATVGGPVAVPKVYNGRDRTFWFFSWQSTRDVGSPGVSTYTTLSPKQRTGDFSELKKTIIDPSSGQPFPGNVIPASRISIPIANFIKRYLPLPTGPNNSDSFPQGGFTTADQFLTRFDHKLSNQDSVAFRWLYNRPLGLTTYGAGIGPGQSWFDDYRVNDQSFTLDETHILTPTMVNHFNFTFQRRTHLMTPRTVFTWQDLGAHFPPSYGALPDNALSVAGYFSTYSGFYWANGRNNPYLSEDLNIVRGKHSISVGTEVWYSLIANRTPYYVDGSASFSGQFSGDPASDFLLGIANSWTQQSANEIDLRQWRLALYAIDDFKVTSRLTLNLGLRWEPFFPYYETYGRQGYWAPGHQSTRFPKAPLGQLFAFDNDPVIPNRDTIVNKRWKNFAPRFGFAWDPAGNRKWSVRGGFGLFYNGLDIGIRTIRGIYNQPFTRVIQLSAVNIDNPYAGAPFNGVSPFPYAPPTTPEEAKTVTFAPFANLVTWDPGFGTSYTAQYNLTLQRGIARDWVVEAAYVGSLARKQFFSHNINPAVYIPGNDATGNPLSTIANTQQRRIYNQIANIEQESTAANANYNSLQIKLDKRFSGGLSIMGSYVFSRALGWNGPLGEGGGGTRNPFNARMDYALIGNDVTHRFVASFIWETPWFRRPGMMHQVLGGWGFEGITLFQSGFPFTVRCGCDNSRTGVGGDTPDLIGDPHLPGGRDRSDLIAQYFNTSVFVPNAIGTFGSVGINSLRGPGLYNVDMAVGKKFTMPYAEKHSLQFRVEFFNMLNQPSFSNPNANLAARGTFGRITSTASTPRVIEFALRYAF
jgi:hypothetical protein